MASLVSTADAVIPIVLACSWVGVQVPEIVYDRPSQKLHCPFGPVYHDDHGVEAAFRVYAHSQSVYCFAGCGYFRSVSLCATAWDLDLDSTAAELLRRYGYKMPGVEVEWERLKRESAQVDHGKLEAALKVYAARRLDNWPACQYTEDSGVSRFLSRCLGLLVHVETPEQANLWRTQVWRAVDQFAAHMTSTRRCSGDSVEF